MPKRPAESPTSTTSSTDVSDQNDWVRKLEHIELDALRTVRTFAAGYNSSVSVVCLDSCPDAMFALKTIRTSDLEEREMALSETKMLSEAQSDFVLKLYRTFEDGDKALHLLTEFLPGGDLFEQGQVCENAAKFYLGCVAEAIDHLHTRNVVHNDVKPSNLMLDADGYVKLIDFGFALQLEDGQKLYDDACGTSEYLPPEVAAPSLPDVYYEEDDEGRDIACDLWAMGVVLYELLTGISPFNPDGTDDQDVIFSNVTEGIESLRFPREHISEDAEDLIRNLCTYEPAFRLGYTTIDEIREHR